MTEEYTPLALFKAATGDNPEEAIRLAAELHGLPLDFVQELQKNESSGDQKAISPKGAIGRFQLMPGTASTLGVNPHDEIENIWGGVKYLGDQYKKFGDLKLAAAAYNAGPKAVEKYGGVPPFPETQNFVSRIFSALNPLPTEVEAAGEMSEEEAKRLAAIAGVELKPKEVVVSPTTMSDEEAMELKKIAGLVPTEPKTPTREEAIAAAKASGVEPEPPGLVQPTFLDPINMLTGIAGIGKAATTGTLGMLTRPGLTAMAKATPGMVASEAAGGAAYSALEGEKNVPEWAKLPLAMATGVAGGMASSKIGQIPGGLKLKMQGGRSPMPSQEVVQSELLTRLNQGKSAQEALEEIATKYGRTASEVISQPAKSAVSAVNVSAAQKVTSPLDSSDLGAPIPSKTITTKVESTLGPIGTEVETIPLHEGHIAMREAFNPVKEGNKVIKVNDIAAPKFMKVENTFKTNERIFSELDDIAPGFHNEFWGKLKWAENIALKKTKEVFAEIDGVVKEYGKKVGDKIGINLISQRATGPERLAKMGLKPEPLTASESQVAAGIQNRFATYLERINEARALSGQQPIKADKNYVTFMVDFIDKVNDGINPIFAHANTFVVSSATPFRFAKKMGSQEKLASTNIFEIFKNYAALAERHINLSPQLKKIQKFVSPMELADGTKIPSLSTVAPNADAALRAMTRVIAGVKPPMSKGERVLGQLSNNLVISTLGAYPRSVINQTGALATGVAETGIGNMMKGLTKVLNPIAWKESAEFSRVLSQRRMDVVLEELGANWVGSAMGKAKHYAMLPLEFMDDLIARATWWASISRGKQLGMTEEMARRYADKVVVRTQASASSIDRAMVQSSTAGKIATAFQTFTIADANYIARNIFGAGNINFSKVDGFKKLAQMSGVGMAINMMQRNLLGMPPGLPEPFAKAGKALEEGAGPIETGWEAAKEVSSFLPLVGSMTYGRSPLGALAGLAGDLAAGTKSPIEGGTMLAGIPAMGVIQRLLKTEGGMELLGDIERETGLPTGPRRQPKTPPLSVKDALLGREPILKKRTPWKADEYLRGLLK